MKPSILLAYPSSFNCSTGIDDVDVKTSLLVLGSYISEYYPIEYMDFEIAVGRPNSRIQIKRFERHVREYFESHPFDILGLSCWTSMSYLATIMVARIFRELYPDKLIVVGGYHPMARPDEFFSDEQLFDYIVTGEGERAFHSIIDEFASSGKRPGKTTIVPGVTTKSDEFVPYNWDTGRQFPQASLPERPAKTIRLPLTRLSLRLFVLHGISQRSPLAIPYSDTGGRPVGRGDAQV